MRNAGGDGSGEGVAYSSSSSLLLRRGSEGVANVIEFTSGGDGEVVPGGLEGFYGVGDEEDEDSTLIGQVEDVIKRKGVELLMWAEIPDWQQHGSELIHTGYRKACYSIWGCLHSWSYLHNETVNIYSHIIGAVLFLLLLPAWIITATIPPRFAIATTEDMLVCGTWLCGVGICFVLSTVFHTLMSHSHSLYNLGMKLDFQGIILLMLGATVPLIYYSFPCHTLIQATYYTATTTLAILCSITTLWPRFSGPHVGHLRAGLFASFGFGSFLVPIVHGIVMYGLEQQSKRISLGWIMVLGTCNGIGVVVYTIKFPEKWFPRTFDIFGASHQVMHVMVVFAALSYTVAVLQAFDFRHGHGMLCV